MKIWHKVLVAPALAIVFLLLFGARSYGVLMQQNAALEGLAKNRFTGYQIAAESSQDISEDFPATGLQDNPDNFRYGNIPAHRKYQGGTIEVKRAGVDNWSLSGHRTRRRP